VAYSVELVLLNKHQIWSGAPNSTVTGCFGQTKN